MASAESECLTGFICTKCSSMWLCCPDSNPCTTSSFCCAANIAFNRAWSLSCVGTNKKSTGRLHTWTTRLLSSGAYPRCSRAALQAASSSSMDTSWVPDIAAGGFALEREPVPETAERAVPCREQVLTGLLQPLCVQRALGRRRQTTVRPNAGEVCSEHGLTLTRSPSDITGIDPVGLQ